MNRAQRREKRKSTPAYLRMSKQDIEKRIMKNGITAKDLQDAYDRGRKEGFANSAEPVMHSCYAAVCLALRELYGFGQKRCCDVINSMDQHMTNSLSSQELVDQVFKDLKITLAFKSIFGDVATPSDVEEVVI